MITSFKHFYLKLNRNQKNIVFLIFFYSPFFVIAQDTIPNQLGDRIPFLFTENSYEFELERNNFKKIRLNSEKMRNYVFNEPGITKIYPISKHNHQNGHDCSAIHLPDTFYILTETYNMQFVENSFKLFSPIYKDKPTKGNYIEIQVNVTKTYDNSPIFLSQKKLYTAGIGTEIYGELDSKCTSLKKGLNTLIYHLEGVCNLNSYIQFDFINNAGKAYSIPYLVKQY